jgi:transposase-like protein
MGPRSSAASAAVNAGGASPVAQAQHFQVTASRTTSSPWGVRWYVRYRLSYAEVSEWLAERGVLVDQSTIYCWVQRFLPSFGEAGRKHRDPIGPDWRVDETYARIRGRWHYI